MSSFVRNGIEYIGIDSFGDKMCPIGETTNFKQANVDLEMCLPCEKPNMEKIIRVKADREIVNVKMVKTPVGTSLEGQTVTGSKALIMADVVLQITYVALNQTQSVHSFHVQVPFCEYVVMPEGYSIVQTPTPDIYIEDIDVMMTDERCIYGSITVLTVAGTC